MKRRTLQERIAQLGRIAIAEAELMHTRNQHGVMPRTKIAKSILKQLINYGTGLY
jgi:hypothetical protein